MQPFVDSAFQYSVLNRRLLPSVLFGIGQDLELLRQSMLTVMAVEIGFAVFA